MVYVAFGSHGSTRSRCSILTFWSLDSFVDGDTFRVCDSFSAFDTFSSIGSFVMFDYADRLRPLAFGAVLVGFAMTGEVFGARFGSASISRCVVGRLSKY